MSSSSIHERFKEISKVIAYYEDESNFVQKDDPFIQIAGEIIEVKNKITKNKELSEEDIVKLRVDSAVVDVPLKEKERKFIDLSDFEDMGLEHFISNEVKKADPRRELWVPGKDKVEKLINTTRIYAGDYFSSDHSNVVSRKLQEGRLRVSKVGVVDEEGLVYDHKDRFIDSFVKLNLDGVNLDKVRNKKVNFMKVHYDKLKNKESLGYKGKIHGLYKIFDKGLAKPPAYSIFRGGPFSVKYYYDPKKFSSDKDFCVFIGTKPGCRCVPFNVGCRVPGYVKMRDLGRAYRFFHTYDYTINSIYYMEKAGTRILPFLLRKGVQYFRKGVYYEGRYLWLDELDSKTLDKIMDSAYFAGSYLREHKLVSSVCGYPRLKVNGRYMSTRCMIMDMLYDEFKRYEPFNVVDVFCGTGHDVNHLYPYGSYKGSLVRVDNSEFIDNKIGVTYKSYSKFTKTYFSDFDPEGSFHYFDPPFNSFIPDKNDYIVNGKSLLSMITLIIEAGGVVLLKTERATRLSNLLVGSGVRTIFVSLNLCFILFGKLSRLKAKS
jgi:hypothetical protein